VNGEPFRIAVVGAGRMGRVHIAALGGSHEIVVGAVIEPLEATRSELARHGVPTFATPLQVPAVRTLAARARGGIDT
jgi:predicted dehydrogenase